MMPIQRVKRRMERRRARGSLRFDVGSPDDLAPFLGFVGDELPEVGGLARNRHAAEVDEPRLHPAVGECRVDLLVELVNDFSGRVPGRTDAVPGARLIAWNEIAHGRNVRQRLRTRGVGDCQCSQLAGPDVFD